MANEFVRAVGIHSVMRGFEELKSQMGGDVIYLVGTNVTYGLSLELGARNHPPYPWMRPAIAELEKTGNRFLVRNIGRGVDQALGADDVVEMAALALERKMVNNVSARAAVDRSPGTHSAHPKRVTGNLAGSIEAVRIR